MTYPIILPPERDNDTPLPDNLAGDVNTLRIAQEGVYEKLGADPSGSHANVGVRLDSIEAGVAGGATAFDGHTHDASDIDAGTLNAARLPAIALADLSNVGGSPSDGQALTWDAGSSSWKPTTIETGGTGGTGGGGGTTGGGSTTTPAPQTFGELTDVDLAGVSDGDTIMYDATSSTWKPVGASSADYYEGTITATSGGLFSVARSSDAVVTTGVPNWSGRPAYIDANVTVRITDSGDHSIVHIAPIPATTGAVALVPGAALQPVAGFPLDNIVNHAQIHGTVKSGRSVAPRFSAVGPYAANLIGSQGIANADDTSEYVTPTGFAQRSLTIEAGRLWSYGTSAGQLLYLDDGSTTPVTVETPTVPAGTVYRSTLIHAGRLWFIRCAHHTTVPVADRGTYIYSKPVSDPSGPWVLAWYAKGAGTSTTAATITTPAAGAMNPGWVNISCSAFTSPFGTYFSARLNADGTVDAFKFVGKNGILNATESQHFKFDGTALTWRSFNSSNDYARFDLTYSVTPTAATADTSAFYTVVQESSTPYTPVFPDGPSQGLPQPLGTTYLTSTVCAVVDDTVAENGLNAANWWFVRDSNDPAAGTWTNLQGIYDLYVQIVRTDGNIVVFKAPYRIIRPSTVTSSLNQSPSFPASVQIDSDGVAYVTINLLTVFFQSSSSYTRYVVTADSTYGSYTTVAVDTNFSGSRYYTQAIDLNVTT